MKTIQKVLVWIYAQNEKNEILVLLLKTGPERGSFWQPVTGSVDEGESLFDAAVRESFEESGLEGKGRVERVDYEFQYHGRWGFVHETVFRMKVDASEMGMIRMDPSEHTEYRWQLIHEVKSLIPHPEVKESFQKAFVSNL